MVTNLSNPIVLTKQSTNQEVKIYFEKILELSQSEEEFPANLDEVWPLVYSEKGKAVRALKRNFIENEDYVTVAQNGNGGKFTSIDYKLSVSCIEYFIARKVRYVFDVYRMVFHKSAKQAIEANLKDKLMVTEWAMKVLNLNEASKLMMVKAVANPLGIPLPDYVEYKGQVLSATALLTEYKCPMSAQKFNRLMMEKGFLTELERPSSKGGVKKFKSLTESGLKYGQNQVCPSNPKETQALYYKDNFEELISILNNTLIF